MSGSSSRLPAGKLPWTILGGRKINSLVKSQHHKLNSTMVFLFITDAKHKDSLKCVEDLWKSIQTSWVFTSTNCNGFYKHFMWKIVKKCGMHLYSAHTVCNVDLYLYTVWPNHTPCRGHREQVEEASLVKWGQIKKKYKFWTLSFLENEHMIHGSDSIMLWGYFS